MRAICEAFGVLEVEGWRISYVEGAFMMFKYIPNTPVISEEKEFSFEYTVKEIRDVCDELDLISFFTEKC